MDRVWLAVQTLTMIDDILGVRFSPSGKVLKLSRLRLRRGAAAPMALCALAPTLREATISTSSDKAFLSLVDRAHANAHHQGASLWQ